jgi:hypothetical protein
MPKTDSPRTVEAKPRAYEPFKVSIVAAIALFVGLAIGAVAIHGALWDWLNHLHGPSQVDAATQWNPAADASSKYQRPPRLQLSPREDWALLHQKQLSNLNSYGWVDRERGIVKAPIAVAMQQIVQRGLPNWSTNNGVSALELQWQRVTNRTKGEP